MAENHPRVPQAVGKSKAPKKGSEAYAVAEETIEYFKRERVDYQVVWWAMGQRSLCNGWGKLRSKMARWWVTHAEREGDDGVA